MHVGRAKRMLVELFGGIWFVIALLRDRLPHQGFASVSGISLLCLFEIIEGCREVLGLKFDSAAVDQRNGAHPARWSAPSCKERLGLIEFALLARLVAGLHESQGR